MGQTTGPSLTLGIVSGESPSVTRALAEGASFAVQQALRGDGPELDIVVAASASHWSTASTPTVELAFESEVVALISPPDRATSHLVAQIGSRAHIPVLSTSRAASIGATGSYWVVPLLGPVSDETPASRDLPPRVRPDAAPEGFASGFRERFGREPDGWATIGYLAASAVYEAARHHPADTYRVIQELKTFPPIPVGE